MRYFIVFFIYSQIFTLYSANAKETWIITSLNWQPYSGDDMNNQGNAIQALRNALQKNGIELLVEFYPWKRAQKLASSKRYIGYFPAWPEEVYAGFIASNTISWSNISVISANEHQVVFDSLDDLFKNYSVGLVESYTYPEKIEINASKYSINVSDALNDLLLLRKLVAGRHQTMITDPLVTEYLAEKHSIEGYKIVKSLYQKPLVVALRDQPDNMRALHIINSAFANY